VSRLAVTGAHGFLGGRLACRLAATRGTDPVRIGRPEYDDPVRLATLLHDVDTVIHVAGVNRADSDDEVEAGNVALAESLRAALGDRSVHIAYADSVQVDLDNAYGRGKRRAAEVLAGLPGTFADVVLPNLFGEHGRPAYNSFVATFCDEIAAGRQPTVHEDRQVPLLHVQSAAESLIVAAGRRESHVVRPDGEPHGVVEVLETLQGFHELYAGRGDVPDVSTGFARDLFNTYRSHLFPHGYPIRPEVHADERGELVEAVRAHGGTGQAFASTTVPGGLRGDHYHLHKIERFMVVRGEAEIALRRLYHDEVVRFRVSGERPAFVDMPTLWAHHIRNVGDSELVTVFWTDQLLDREHPDQYPLKVEERP
jgi:UDP-2-acetamido-2,6-beta-L-arabino-hexul-4-ose reductase